MSVLLSSEVKSPQISTLSISSKNNEDTKERKHQASEGNVPNVSSVVLLFSSAIPNGTSSCREDLRNAKHINTGGEEAKK